MKVGVKWADFTKTDNSCAAAPRQRLTRPTDLDTAFDDVGVLEKVRTVGKCSPRHQTKLIYISLSYIWRVQ